MSSSFYSSSSSKQTKWKQKHTKTRARRHKTTWHPSAFHHFSHFSSFAFQLSQICKLKELKRKQMEQTCEGQGGNRKKEKKEFPLLDNAAKKRDTCRRQGMVEYNQSLFCEKKSNLQSTFQFSPVVSIPWPQQIQRHSFPIHLFYHFKKV